jgi:hypothetical protein
MQTACLSRPGRRSAATECMEAGKTATAPRPAMVRKKVRRGETPRGVEFMPQLCAQGEAVRNP